MGSVFSPHYARAYARAPQSARPTQHLAINLALYGERRAWVFTEAKANTPGGALSATTLRAGNNTWQQTDEGLVLTINDRSVPWGRPIVGRIVLRGQRAKDHGPRVLCAEGQHHWWPILPVAHIEVDMQSPKLHWRGHAYHDLNFGDAPLAQGFSRWSWMRTTRPEATDIVYAVHKRGHDAAQAQTLSLTMHRDGTVTDRAVPPLQPLPVSGWRLRGVGCDLPDQPGALQLLEDTPFYRRSMWPVMHNGTPAGVVMHEALDMDRWQRSWVRALMPFRLRRI